MKKLVFVLLATIMFACSCEIMPDPDVHFIDEDFVLIEKNEGEKVVDGNTKIVRSWKIQRVIVNGDSIMVAEIDDSGCDCILTEELWYSRDVGVVLHFEYIRKDRFNYVRNLVYGDEYEAVETPRSVTPEDVRAETANNMSEVEADLRALEIEREIMALEREKESLNK